MATTAQYEGGTTWTAFASTRERLEQQRTAGVEPRRLLERAAGVRLRERCGRQAQYPLEECAAAARSGG
jgi:predicted HicB family RNase H-like nuclease